MREDRGQSLVEFALTLPILMLVVIGIMSVGSTYSNYLRLTDAVRVGGRAAATGVDVTSACSAATSAMQTTLGSAWGNVVQPISCVSSTINGDPAVEIRASWPFSIDILGHSYGVGNLTSTATERLG